MKLWSYYKDLIISSRVWIAAVLVIFIFGVVGGTAISLNFPSLTKSVISSYASSLDKNLRPGLGESLYIFRRNFFIVTLTIFSGIFFGLLPVVVIYVNGFILGILIGYKPLYQVLNPWQIFLLLSPHGIFEYSATFLGLAFGLRLGLNWLLPTSRKKRWKTLEKNLKEALAITVLVGVILFGAALIEGVFTVKIACFFGGLCSHALQRRIY